MHGFDLQSSEGEAGHKYLLIKMQICGSSKGEVYGTKRSFHLGFGFLRTGELNGDPKAVMEFYIGDFLVKTALSTPSKPPRGRPKRLARSVQEIVQGYLGHKFQK